MDEREADTEMRALDAQERKSKKRLVPISHREADMLEQMVENLYDYGIITFQQRCKCVDRIEEERKA